MSARAEPPLACPDGEATASAVADVDVFELAAVGMVVTDESGRFRRVNPAFARLTGRDRSELLGWHLDSLASHHESTAAIARLLSRAVDSLSCDQRLIRPDGSAVWVEMRIRSLVAPDGPVYGLLVQAMDITGRRAAEEAAIAGQRRLEEAQQLAGMSSFEIDPASGLIRASRHASANLGLPPAFAQTDLMDHVHPEDRAMVTAALGRCVREHDPVDHVQRHVRPDGSIRWIHARAAWTTGEDGRGTVMGTTLDITDLKNAEETLRFQAFHDALTGLANRALFLDRVEHAAHQQERRGDPIAVLLIDLDDFKTVNDSLGHTAGDQLLVDVAGRLADVTRAGDTLARLGGDEFALLVESGPMPRTAERLADRLEAALRAPFQLACQEIPVRASIGIAVSGGVHDAFEDLLRDADLAMYLAKQNGKGRYEVARPGMRSAAATRMSMISDLRHALDHDELEVFYQPVVDATTADPTGAEALVRWRHPRLGLLTPDAFIGLAESTGLIGPLGDWVLRRACAQAQAWRRDGVTDDRFSMSVNLSARQLADPAVVGTVAQALRESGLPPTSLVLEITESMLMVDFEAGLDRLRALKALGPRIALDDYGTGYSSLNRLARLPVDIVKIDKTFVDRLAGGEDGTALVRSVLDVTRALALGCVAEGVEHEAQRVLLAGLGCGHLQGYLFSRPLPADEAAAVVRRLRRAAGRVGAIPSK